MRVFSLALLDGELQTFPPKSSKISVTWKANIWELFASTTEINMMLRKKKTCSITCMFFFWTFNTRHAKLAMNSYFTPRCFLKEKKRLGTMESTCWSAVPSKCCLLYQNPSISLVVQKFTYTYLLFHSSVFNCDFSGCMKMQFTYPLIFKDDQVNSIKGCWPK